MSGTSEHSAGDLSDGSELSELVWDDGDLDADNGGLPSSSTGGKRGRDTGISGDKKKELERERNRQYARNTRARKKQHVEKLKERIEKLTKEKAEMEEQKKAKALQEQELRALWRRNLERLLTFRAQGVVNEDHWLSIVTEGIKLAQPVTPYRFSLPSDLVNNRQVITGVEGMCRDAASIFTMGEVFCGPPLPGTPSMTPTLEFRLGTDGYMFLGTSGMMCTFNMKSVGSTSRGGGAVCDVSLSGMVRTVFAADGKIEEVDIVFDPITFYDQLRRAIPGGQFALIPNTVAEASKAAGATAILHPTSPYQIEGVNEEWASLVGCTMESAKGKTVSELLEVNEQDPSSAPLKEALERTSLRLCASSASVWDREKFHVRHICCYPLISAISTSENRILCVLRQIVGVKSEDSVARQ